VIRQRRSIRHRRLPATSAAEKVKTSQARSPGRPTKLPRDREAAFKARLDAGPTAADGGVCTLRGRDVVAILEREFGVTYSLDGAYDLLERLGYSCLTPRPAHEKADPAAVADFKARAPLLSTR
jgi:transposase